MNFAGFQKSFGSFPYPKEKLLRYSKNNLNKVPTYQANSIIYRNHTLFVAIGAHNTIPKLGYQFTQLFVTRLSEHYSEKNHIFGKISKFYI